LRLAWLHFERLTEDFSMYRSQNEFVALADRAEAGDAWAQGELCRTLEPEMVRIVRRVVQSGSGRSSMDRRILVEADRIGLDAEAAASADGELLIRKLARFLSAVFIDGLRSRSLARVDETICG
jgi:hypothetical protein